MVNHTAIDKNTSINDVKDNLDNPKCKFQNSTTRKNPDGPYLWDKQKQEFILSAFFAGYFIMQVKKIVAKCLKIDLKFSIGFRFLRAGLHLNLVA